jgi:hypothetical protein
MLKMFATAGALALAGCSTSGVQQFAQNAATAATGVDTLNTALISLNATIIVNTSQLAQALAKVDCPIVNSSVSLGAAISADPNAAANVKAVLTEAGSAGALASDICIAAGLGPSTVAAP